MNLRRIGPQSERNRRSLETEKEGAEEKGREARGLFARAWAFLCGLAAGQKGKIAMRSDWHKELQDLRQFAESKGKENWRPESLTEVVKVTKFTAKEVKVIYRAFKQSSPSGVVSREEFNELFASLFPHGDSDASSPCPCSPRTA